MDETHNEFEAQLRDKLVDLISILMGVTFPGSAVTHDKTTHEFTITVDSINSRQLETLIGPTKDFMKVTITADRGLFVISILPGDKFKKKTE